MKKLVIVGAAHAYVLKTLNAINAAEKTWDLLGFIDDDPEKQGQELHGSPILGDRSLLPKLAAQSDTHFFNNVMGHWPRRLQVFELLENQGCRIASLIDPRIDVLDLHHGRGVFIAPFACLGTSLQLGDYTVVMYRVALGDETTVGSNVFVGTGAAVGSRAVVGDNTFIGPQAVVLMDRVVGKRAVIGANSTVTKDVADDTQVFGSPARPR